MRSGPSPTMRRMIELGQKEGTYDENYAVLMWGSKDTRDYTLEPTVMTNEPKDTQENTTTIVEADVQMTATGPQTMCGEIAEARAELVESELVAGKSLTAIAAELGTTRKELEGDPAVQGVVQDVIKRFRLTAAQRKELVRAKLNEVLLTGENRDVLQAAKLIGEDPEVGIGKGAPQVMIQSVSVFSEETMKAMEGVKMVLGGGEGDDETGDSEEV